MKFTSLARLGGVLTVAASVGLAIWVAARPGASFNVLNLYTVVMGAGAGLLVLVRPARPRLHVVVIGLIVLALLPVVVPQPWPAYAPALVLLLMARLIAMQRFKQRGGVASGRSSGRKGC